MKRFMVAGRVGLLKAGEVEFVAASQRPYKEYTDFIKEEDPATHAGSHHDET